MKVEVVGTSCNWFSRHNTSFILDDKILFDVPLGNYKQIIKSININDIEWIFISHFHDDHFADLKIITTRFIRENFVRKEKLRIYAPKGLAEKIIDINKVYQAAEDETQIDILKDAVDFIDIHDGMEFVEGEYKVKVYKMQHGKVETYGLTFTDKSGKTVAFSADTVDCDNLEKMLSISNFAFVDMAAPTPSKTHLFTHDFVNLSLKFNKCKMFPVHTSDKTQEFAEKNNLNFLHDGQILEL